MTAAEADRRLDEYTRTLLDELFASAETPRPSDAGTVAEVRALYEAASAGGLTGPVVRLFQRLRTLRKAENLTPDVLGLSRVNLIDLALRHQEIDEHGVTVGGRVGRALSIVEEADRRVEEYLRRKDSEAPSGIELWERLQKNISRVRKALGMSRSDWESYGGQSRYAIGDVETLARVIDLPARMTAEAARAARNNPMRLTPYYASLIQPGTINDPCLLQSVPTGEMAGDAEIDISPAADGHSPARLVDQVYPRTATIKTTAMCAMFCTHCPRPTRIGREDRVYTEAAYAEALDYIRNNHRVRDVLVTGGDALVLPNAVIRKLLSALDGIEHVRLKRLGTRMPVTAPQRIDDELLDILAASNAIKPLRVVTQINTAQEITPLSKDAFRRISDSVSAVLNQAVLLKGINDTRVKMWKLCETVQESCVRPYYLFNCSHQNPRFAHLRVPIKVGRDLVESMYGNISGDAIPRYIVSAGGKIPLHRSNVVSREGDTLMLRKPWNDELVNYPDADPLCYRESRFAFDK